MFTGLVVDNFAYVFQLYGKVKAIDREEGACGSVLKLTLVFECIHCFLHLHSPVRRFKNVWSDFDLNRTGYLQRHQFIPFFAVRSIYLDVM